MKVLVSDVLGEIGIQMFQEEDGIEVDVQTDLSPEELKGVIGAYDALVIRMKFTCKPGKQWMIKRSAYRLVQEALAQKGIHFASRQVTVHVPESDNTDPDKLKQALVKAGVNLA